MTASLLSITWPETELASALEALASASNLSAGQVLLPPAPAGQELDRQWLETAGLALGIEVEELQVCYHELNGMLGNGGPAILPVEIDGERRLLLLLGRSRRRLVRVLGPDQQPVMVAREIVHNTLTAPFEGQLAAQIDGILDAAKVLPRRRLKSRRALLDEHLGSRSIGICWILRSLPGSPFHGQLRRSGQIAGSLALVLCHLAQTMLFLAAWWLVGRGALAGDLDSAWLAGWGLMLVTLVPLRMLTVYLQGRVVLGIGALLKRRLLAGVLKLDLEAVKHQGAGMLLGQVLESNALEALVLGGGYRTLLAAVEIAVTVWLLSNGAGGGWHAVLFMAWVGLTIALTSRFWLRIKVWTTARMDLTHELAERLVGHRTRLVQQSPEDWHKGEDELLERYIEASLSMDRIPPWLFQSAMGWRVVGMAALVGPFVSGVASVPALAVGLGGLLLGSQALKAFSSGLSSLAIAVVAWQRVAHIFHAAAASVHTGALLPPSTHIAGEGSVLLSVHDLGFSYPGRSRRAIDGANLVIRHGERLLLLGPSGGGKSTLVGLLCALRVPDVGLVLCHGLDLSTLGERKWRRVVAAAPQFHDNHVLTETFAFNLLMGRNWPPSENELGEAEELCRELGLGELLDRMPSGMMQMVGDTGWHLSHGERSRLFVARALLQNADLVILDESFGALDPFNMKRAIDCARRHAGTLAVVAHP